ncbi:hypothetical protein M569_08846 [Genlisea aurea]|uniref:Armadillo repeat-containing protein 8 n=1 Tax=Genlisea aurea TaxID=192259 RepID=S8E0Z9_9LAMI|nr:hypothetical protein M569_08846 [Genlisea aurea]
MKISGGSDGPARLIERLKSCSNHEEKAKSVRELKNQIIGNRTKKLTYLSHGAAAVVAGMMTGSGGSETDVESREAVLIQCGAVLGSLACGLDAGVEAVVDAGGLPILMELVSSSNEKVADVGARSLKLIYRSKRAPKIDFLRRKNVEFLISLLENSATSSVDLGAQLIAHSCTTPQEQQHLADSGIAKPLAALLLAGCDARDSALKSIAALARNNPKFAEAFVAEGNGAVSPLLIRLLADRRNPRTRLRASICLVNLRRRRNSSRTCLGVDDDDLIEVLVDTIGDDAATSDESAALALCDMIDGSEDPKFIVDRLFDRLKQGSVSQNRMRGIVLALFQICTKLNYSKVIKSKP